MTASSDGMMRKHVTIPTIPRIIDASANPDRCDTASPPEAQPGGAGGGGANSPGVGTGGGPGT
jgi:hypothetical protein